jgi:hypothetical protein
MELENSSDAAYKVIEWFKKNIYSQADSYTAYLNRNKTRWVVEYENDFPFKGRRKTLTIEQIEEALK